MAKKVVLNNGINMPSLGLGTWQADPFPGLTGPAIEVAVRTGYRHIDCAFLYQNEEEVGEALEKLFQEGVVKREDMFIASKLWSCYHNPDEVEQACRDSLQRLKLDYLDLFMIHTPFGVKSGTVFPTPDSVLGYDAKGIAATWKAMESLIPLGLVKAIGVSNFTITKLETLLATAEVIPAVNQVESNPQFLQRKLRDYCLLKSIIFVAYSPLGSPGRLEKEDDDVNVLEDETVKAIAATHKATTAQICIAFLLNMGDVTIPKSTDELRVKENFEATKIQLEPDEMESMKKLDKNYRRNTYDWLFRPELDSIDSAWDVTADSVFVVD